MAPERLATFPDILGPGPREGRESMEHLQVSCAEVCLTAAVSPRPTRVTTYEVIAQLPVLQMRNGQPTRRNCGQNCVFHTKLRARPFSVHWE